jgi:hypothetical protein
MERLDFMIMLYQFIGGLIVFLLILNSDLQWITGNVVFIGNVIYYSFLGLGIILPAILFFIVLIFLKEKN